MKRIKDYERWANPIFRQLYKIGILSPMLTPLMLAVSLATTIFTMVEYRGLHPYIGIPLIFIGLIVLILFVCYLAVDVLQIQRSQKAALFTYDPMANKHLSPFQQMWWKYSYVPMMEFMITGDKEVLTEGLERMKRWAETGFIPSEDFPDELKKYCKLKDKRI